MGLFLSISSIVGVSNAEVYRALESFATENKYAFEVKRGTIEEVGFGVIYEKSNNVTILSPNNLLSWDDVSKYISSVMGQPVFSMHIHDEDFWMYTLFDKGEEIDHFNPYPAYWDDDISAKERSKWRGNADLISRLVPDVAQETIASYLTSWEDMELDAGKAYPDDKFPYGDCWQMLEFMRKLHLPYPIDENGTILGETFFLEKSNITELAAVKRNKQWWKFWER